MIPPWRHALQQALAALAPGGSLHIVDFGEQARLPRWFSAGLRAGSRSSRSSRATSSLSSWRALRRRPGSPCGTQQLYRGYAVYAVVTKLAHN